MRELRDLRDKRATRASVSNVSNARSVHRDLLERALLMRCISYMADAKAKLLIRTVSHVGQAKRHEVMRSNTLRESLEALKQENEARLALEQRLREVTDAVDLAPSMIIVERGGRVVYTNSSYREAAQGAGDSSTLVDAIRAVCPTAVQGLSIDDSTGPWNGEFEWNDAGGNARWLRVSVGPRQHTPDGEHLICVMEDVTEERSARIELGRSHRMDALGQLVGGVAHDFNNMLTVLAANLDLLDVLPSEEHAPVIEQLRQSVARGGDLTRQLLAFARRQVLDAKQVVVQEVVDRLTQLLHRALGEEHCLVTDHKAAKSVAFCDVGQLENALTNMVLNARDASPPGGRIEIAVDVMQNSTPRPCGAAVLPAGSFVRVSVSDQGPGIAPDILDSIWEPFVSTKDDADHSGLGLSMVSGFATQSGGGVEAANSDPGAVFHLYLPAVPDH